ncbi:hypothetical protein F511_43979 [Dorcoceras hygrometricum]|uniref:Uncharacterized protein n=1 Tax=Dorcoceras hygrometricum TaxID=472368 RepID=A0A2Z7BEH9_9LAMI|nr:hypothetical protein F511_43979 [Dorcoceras hygrometricum]
MVEMLHCWSRALAARCPGGAASLVAREGAFGAFIVRRCWTAMARRWLRCWSTLAGDVARRWPDEATLAARWLRTMRAGCATLRAASCAAAVIFVVVAPPDGRRSGEAPAIS